MANLVSTDQQSTARQNPVLTEAKSRTAVADPVPKHAAPDHQDGQKALREGIFGGRIESKYQLLPWVRRDIGSVPCPSERKAVACGTLITWKFQH